MFSFFFPFIPLAGEMWPVNGEIYDPDTQKVMGNANENCFRTDDSEAYRCDGAVYLKGCSGLLAYGGRCPNDATGGQHIITGGTQNFKDAKRIVTSSFDEATGLSLRVINFE